MPLNDQAESALQRLPGGFFEQLFEGAGLPIFVCNTDGRIHSGNRLANQILPAESGAFMRDLLPESARPRFDDGLATLLDTGEPLEFRVRLTVAGKDNEYATWLTPVENEAGHLDRVAVWFHDITARMELRRSLRQRERLTSLGVLSGAVAHHYNNLLCCIATSLEYAMNMNTMTAMRRALNRTADAAARGNELTQQLLAFAQGDYRAEHESDVTETVLFFFDEQESRLAEVGIKLDLEWIPVPMRAIPREQVMIVLNNLTNNAREAMPDGGTLTVRIGMHDDGHIMLSITDSGPGINPDHIEHVFEPFFTTKGALGDGTTRQVGMGLAVAHGLISELHGTISVSNVPTGGARFEIVLPIGKP